MQFHWMKTFIHSHGDQWWAAEHLINMWTEQSLPFFSVSFCLSLSLFSSVGFYERTPKKNSLLIAYRWICWPTIFRSKKMHTSTDWLSCPSPSIHWIILTQLLKQWFVKTCEKQFNRLFNFASLIRFLCVCFCDGFCCCCISLSLSLIFFSSFRSHEVVQTMKIRWENVLSQIRYLSMRFLNPK